MIFLDSSLLVRRYGGRNPRSLADDPPSSPRYCLSDLSRVEVASAIERWVREGDLGRAAADAALTAFRRDLPRYLRIPLDEDVLDHAAALVRRRPLRSLDALQLASAIVTARESPVDFRFGSADARLNAAAKAEGLEIL